MGVKLCCGDSRNNNDNIDNFNGGNTIEEYNQPAVPTVLTHIEINENLISESIFPTFKSKEGEYNITDKRVFIFNLAS